MPKAKTKAAAPAKIHAVVGSDDVEVKHIAAELAEKLKPADAGDFGLEIIDGAADNADQAAARIRSTIEALRTLPFFGGAKVVWLKNANFLGDDQKARSASVQTALEELMETIDEGFGSELSFSDQRNRSRQTAFVLQIAGQTRGAASFRQARFQPRRLGSGSDGNCSGAGEKAKTAIR